MGKKYMGGFYEMLPIVLGLLPVERAKRANITRTVRGCVVKGYTKNYFQIV